jgi:hypothetical protein
MTVAAVGMAAIAATIAAPAEARILRRTALVPAIGTTCLSLPDPTSCLFVGRFGIDFIVGDLHLGGLVGGNSAGPVGGLQIGLDLGTPYFVAVHGRRGHALAIAVRASLDNDLLAQAGAFNRYVFSNTYGPNLSIGLGSWRISLYTRIAAGFSVTALTRSDLHIQQCCEVHPAVDAQLGLHVWL